MSKLDDLMAKIKADVQVRRNAKGRVTVDSAKIRRDHQAENALKDPALRALYAQANAKAKEILLEPLDPYAGWLEKARVTLLGRQLCKTCGRQHDYVAGEFLRMQGYAPRGVGVQPLKTEVLVKRPSNNPNLPDETEWLSQVESVDRCPECATLGHAIDEAIDHGFNNVAQGRLFS